MQIDLSIIFVNWNGGTLLSRAVESVVTFPPSVEYEVVVVDNGSKDDSIALLRSCEAAKSLNDRGRLRVIENADNRGFGAANNQGFELTDTPLIFLLNPDAEVTEGTIDRLIETVRADPHVAAAGPRILNPDGSLQISVWRNPPAAWDILLSNLKLYKLLPRKVRGELLLGGHWDHNTKRSVPMLSGAAMLVRRDVIKSLGGFDERFHMYGEDHEWCFRMTSANWKLMFEPEAVVTHHAAWSSLQRWGDLETIRVRLDAHYSFQKNAVSRFQLMTSTLAYCITQSGQLYWRRLRRVDAPELKLIKDVYWEHLRRTLTNGTG